MEAELRFHLEMEVEKNIRRGMSEKEAQAEARRSFGGIDQTKENYRDLVRLRWIENLWGDLQYGARILRQSPGFTLIAIMTLSLGIGANTAIFSVVNMFLFRPLPVERPAELAAVFANDPCHSYTTYIDLRDYNDVFSGLAAHKIATAAINLEVNPGETNDRHVDVIRGEIVSGNYFDVLGVRPVLGRSFTPVEDRAPNAHPVVVLSYGLWQRQFRSDPKLVGRSST